MKKKILVTLGALAPVLLLGAAVIGYQDWQLRGSAPGNPASGFLRVWADSTAGYFKCLTSAGAACHFEAPATSSALGIVETDGATISNASGTISCATATTSQLGCAKPDGTTITVSGGVYSASSGTPTHFTDFPDKKYTPAANCNNATAGNGWSLPTSSAPTAACHTGTNAQDGYLTFADAQSAQFSYLLPDDWDSASSLDLTLFFTDSSTSGTVIFQAASSCTTIAGAETDDQAFNSAKSLGTITLSTPASAGWVASLTGLTKTGCAAGNFLHVKISRTTDTATGGANVSGAQLTARRTF